MKFSGYYFYINTNIKGDFQICISVPLIYAEYRYDIFHASIFHFKVCGRFVISLVTALATLSNVFRLIKPLKMWEELAFYFWFLMVKGRVETFP